MTLNRLFLICLAIIGVSWISAYVVDFHQRTDDQTFYAKSVSPQLKSSGAFTRGGPMDQWLERIQRRNDNAMLRMNLLFGAIGLMFVWTIATLIKTEAFWKKRNGPTRSADVNAGWAIGEVQRRDGQLVARTSKRGLQFLPHLALEIEVNFQQRTATFRGFRFLTSFIVNKPCPELILPFADIIGGRTWSNHGRFVLNLRTTAGRVAIPDQVQPFQPLAAVLLDVAEVNRKNPTAFAAALAREPQIKTPWYGWLILALALAGVAGLAAFLWNLPTK